MPNDFRTALRSLTKNPGVTLLSVVSMGLGIGLTTGTFSIADARLLRPFPIARPSELYEVTSRSDDGRLVGYGWPDYEDMVAAGAAEVELAGYSRRASIGSSGSSGTIVKLMCLDMPGVGLGQYFRIIPTTTPCTCTFDGS